MKSSFSRRAFLGPLGHENAKVLRLAGFGLLGELGGGETPARFVQEPLDLARVLGEGALGERDGAPCDLHGGEPDLRLVRRLGDNLLDAERER